MKELIYQWVEEHKGENQDGTWFVYDIPSIGEKQFATEQELDEFLWAYADRTAAWIPGNY